MNEAGQTSQTQMNTPDDAMILASALVMLPVSDQARIVEAVLFAATEPLTVAQLRAAVPGDADMGAALEELQALYADRGITLKEVDGRYAFRTADCVAPHLYQFRREEKKLPRAALETLAIIAYHQPITRPEIENIRGVAVAKGTIDLLMEMGWVKPGKRREIPGRPLTWLTTPAFLDHFGLSALTDLPGMEDLKASGLLDTRPAIETIPDLFAGEDAQLAQDAGLTDSDEAEMDEGVTSDSDLMASVSSVFALAANENDDEEGEEKDEDSADDDFEDDDSRDDEEDFESDEDDDDDDFEDDDEEEDDDE